MENNTEKKVAFTLPENMEAELDKILLVISELETKLSKNKDALITNPPDTPIASHESPVSPLPAEEIHPPDISSMILKDAYIEPYEYDPFTKGFRT